MLTLLIKKKWLDMILSGEKKEEYREIKPYYNSRFNNENNYSNWMQYLDKIILIKFRNGYSSKSLTVGCCCKIIKGYGKEEWGAERNKEYYVLKILNVEEL